MTFRERLTEILQTLSGFALLIGFWFAVAWGIPAYLDSQVTCTSETIPFTKQTKDNPNDYTGVNAVVNEGKPGSKEVCKKNDGTITKESVTAAPVDEVTSIGTRERTPIYIAPNPTPAYSGGAICNDGSRSYSTGRGTCSHHGGVAEWL